MNITQTVTKKNEKETVFLFTHCQKIIRAVLPNNLIPKNMDIKEFRLITIYGGYCDSYVITIKSSKIIKVRNAYGDDYKLVGWKMKIIEQPKMKACPE